MGNQNSCQCDQKPNRNLKAPAFSLPNSAYALTFSPEPLKQNCQAIFSFSYGFPASGREDSIHSNMG
jgi:hypothetical protein